MLCFQSAMEGSRHQTITTAPSGNWSKRGVYRDCAGLQRKTETRGQRTDRLKEEQQFTGKEDV